MRPLVVIPARGGSKGIPGKNIKLLNGKPLIHYTIDAARGVFDDEQICVSTDDMAIKSCAEDIGLSVPFIRPQVLATDTAEMRDVLIHAIEFYADRGYDADTLVLLQPTSPFRDSGHIKKALELFNEGLDMVVSVKQTKSNPYYVLFEENEAGYLRKSKEGFFGTRQQCPKVWEFNGGIYIVAVSSLKEKKVSQFERVVKYEMDDFSSLDIDEPIDWEIAEFLMAKNMNNSKSTSDDGRV